MSPSGTGARSSRAQQTAPPDRLRHLKSRIARAYVTGGIEALRKSVAPGPAPIKTACALAVAEEVLSGPVAGRPNWTLPRLADEIERRAGVRISSSRLSVVLRQKGISAGDDPAIR